MKHNVLELYKKQHLLSHLISTYTTRNNKKEIYFRLTEKGQQLFKDHELRRIECKKRDIEI